MAKELPFFKWTPEKYITGDITLCSFESQGVFANLCSFYWAKRCIFSLANAKQRYSKCLASFQELLDREIIKLDSNENLIIEFLDEQMNEFINLSEKRAKSGRKGGKANAKQMLSKKEAKSIYKEEDKEEDKEEENIIENEKFNFKKSLLNLGIEVNIVSDWLKVRRKKKASNTETAFNSVKSQIEKSGLTANECIKLAVEKSWSGFEAEWVNNKKEKSNWRNLNNG